MDSRDIATELVTVAKILSGGMSPLESAIIEIQETLQLAEKKLRNLTWDEEELPDRTLGKDVNALHTLIQSAIGRSDTVMDDLVSIRRRGRRSSIAHKHTRVSQTEVGDVEVIEPVGEGPVKERTRKRMDASRGQYSIDDLTSAVRHVIEEELRKSGSFDESDESFVLIVANTISQWFVDYSDNADKETFFNGESSPWNANVITRSELQEAKNVAQKVARAVSDVEDVSKSQLIAMVKRILGPKKRREAADTDPMADERLAGLYVKFETWLVQKVTKLPASAPVAVQMMKGLEQVKRKLNGKYGLRGRAAVEELAKAMSGTFTLEAPPWPKLIRKYGMSEIRDIFRGW